jgi:beta-phosphoglucomutase
MINKGDLNMSIKAFIFDLDGVITDTAELHYLAWKKLADSLNMYFDKEQNEALKGVSRIGSLEIILKNNGKLDCYTQEEKEAMADKKNIYYKELVETLTEKDILPGIKELLTDIRAKGYKTAIASVSKNAPRVLERIGLMNYFDVIADAAKVKRSKPDPEIFLTCAEQLSIDPRDCVGIEDSQAGIEAIHSAGMFSVGINVTVISQEPDLVLKSTSELDLNNIKTNFENRA